MTTIFWDSKGGLYVDFLTERRTINTEYCSSLFEGPVKTAFSNMRKSFCLMVEASDYGYVLHTRRIHVTRYRIRIQHQWRLAILDQFSVLI
jgi:hypothetical protein